MSREYDDNCMLKSKGIKYFPPVKSFEEALKIYKECGGMILSLEDDGYLVDEPLKIAKLYDLEIKHLEHYFKHTLEQAGLPLEEVENIINSWLAEEDIVNLKK